MPMAICRPGRPAARALAPRVQRALALRASSHMPYTVVPCSPARAWARVVLFSPGFASQAWANRFAR